jgi:Camelysin metallo-endopeptidase
MKDKVRKLLLTALTVGMVGTIAGFGVFAAFTDTNFNGPNEIASGTVRIDDNDTGVALYNVANRKPGDSSSRCIRVTYSGSLGAAVKLYVSSGITNGTLYNLQIERGSFGGAFAADCTGFTAATTAYNGQLGSFPTTYGTGVDGKDAGAAWATSDAVDYKFTITQNDDTTVGAHRTVKSSGDHTFTWEARNN